ncbi:MAG: SGNH/GDSL hydrolase family protein [Desulfobaccales bacterium]
MSNFPRIKNTILGLITILMSGLAAFGVVEMAVRAFTPQMSGEVVYGYDESLGAIPMPYQRGVKTPPEGPSYNFSHNSMGFRGTKEYRTKQASFRVLFLGDSFTYGVGVNDDQAFPYLVEKILQDRNYSVETINAGNPGVGTDYELKFIQTLGEKLKADLVVLCFFWNDFYDNALGGHFRLGENGELIPKTPHSLTAKKVKIENLPGIYWLLSRSQAANLVKVSIVDFLRWLPKTVAKFKNKPETPPADAKLYPGALPGSKYKAENPSGLKQLTQIYIIQLIKAVKAQGSDILFLYLPDASQVDQYRKTGQISSYEKDFFEIVESQGHKPYSLTSCLTGVKERMDLPYWGHWSPATNREAAKYISVRLEEWLQTRSLWIEGS